MKRVLISIACIVMTGLAQADEWYRVACSSPNSSLKDVMIVKNVELSKVDSSFRFTNPDTGLPVYVMNVPCVVEQLPDKPNGS